MTPWNIPLKAELDNNDVKDSTIRRHWQWRPLTIALQSGIEKMTLKNSTTGRHWLWRRGENHTTSRQLTMTPWKFPLQEDIYNDAITISKVCRHLQWRHDNSQGMQILTVTPYWKTATKSGLLVHKQIFCSANKLVNNIVHQAKISFYSTKILASKHPGSFSASQTLFSAKSNPHRYPRPFLSLNFYSAFLTSFTVR